MSPSHVFIGLVAGLGLTTVGACARPAPTSRAPASTPPERVSPPPQSHVAPPATPEPASRSVPLRIGSWNIRRLGHGTKDLQTVSSILTGFDIVATQEVMTREVINTLDNRMPSHQVVLTDTPRPRNAKYQEYFAFFYRADRLRPTFSSYVPDPDNRFVRDPFVACFAVIDSDGGRDGDELCLMTVHIVWGKRVGERKQEILALDDAMRWAQSKDTTSAWVVLGDFNRVVDDGDADDRPEEEWAELLSPDALEVPLMHIGVDVPTTLGADGYANAYDHIFVSGSLAKRVVDAGRFDFVAEHCAGEFDTCKTTVSDHAPVTLRLRAP